MDAWVEIRNNATGEVRRHRHEDWQSHSVFWWTEGNASCDCNRGLFFARDGGRELTDEEEDAFECGDDAYTAIRAVLDDGTVIALDDP
jgi:hypothetical protein